jgi:chromosome segregation protein
MRLTKIKLAGFKSFVDPTTIFMPSNLVGIVGPNGCGKSNTIDAVRWVMGESSAKNLRGGSMEDVIFSGSSARKPVAQASVELVFDNTDSTIGGEYASYNEIAIRRQVSREGQSQYFLNGTRCRRRDITDIFLGTGLGPRSYAIIEQGTISRLIEAKPQELRVFLEEAAGISKYKERRRETENRMRHTRDNLDRLNDLREEIGKQLSHLKRQATMAEKYKTYKTDERRTKAEVITLKLADFSTDLETREAREGEMETALEKRMAQIREAEANIETLREQRTESTESFNLVQALFYQIGNDISRAEQTIQHQRELFDRQQQEQSEADLALKQANREIDQDKEKLEILDQQIGELQPVCDTSKNQLTEAQEKLRAAEKSMSDWQTRWDEYTRNAAEPVQQAQVEKTRMEHLEQQTKQLEVRRQRLGEERQRLSTESLEQQCASLATDVTAQQEIWQSSQAALENAQAQIQSLREKSRSTRQELETKQREARQIKGRLASLEALQQAALGKEQQAAQSWLDTQALSEAARLGESIEAEDKWSAVIEMVLGDYLEAVETDSLDGHAASLHELSNGHVLLYEHGTIDPSASADTLWSVVKAPASVFGLLNNILLADDLEQAMRMRGRLEAQQSVVTPDGLWLGPHWLRYYRERDEHAGVLARKQEIGTLNDQVLQLDKAIEQGLDALEKLQQAEQTQEQEQSTQQSATRQANQLFAEVKSKLSNSQSRLESTQQRRSALDSEVEEIATQITDEQTALDTARKKRNQALESAESFRKQAGELQSQRDMNREQLDEKRRGLDGLRTTMHEQDLQLQSIKSSRDNTKNNHARMLDQVERLTKRVADLAQALTAGEDPIRNIKQQLEQLLQKRVVQEQALNVSRQGLESVESELRDIEQQRLQDEEVHNQQREQLQALKLASQELKVRSQTLLEQLKETDFDLETLRQEMPQEANTSDWEQ